MRNVGKSIETDNGVYNERHLKALIRRKMMSKVMESKKKYSRKIKHKNDSYK